MFGNAVAFLCPQQLTRRHVEQLARHQQLRPFDVLDRIDVIAHQCVHQRLREAVRLQDDHVRLTESQLESA